MITAIVGAVCLAVGGFAGMKYGAAGVAKAKADLAVIEGDVRSLPGILAASAADRLKAIAGKL